MEKFFNLNVNNGEILVLDLSGLKKNTEKFFELLDKSMLYLIKPTCSPRVALDLYDTRMPEQAVRIIAENLKSREKKITRLAIKGMPSGSRYLFKKYNRKLQLSFPVRFFTDYEIRKAWLTGEN